MWINWNDLPESMKNEQVRHYYKILKKKQGSLIVKRGFDIVASLVMLILLSWLLLLKWIHMARYFTGRYE